jgi:WD40 repeat protein
MEEALRGLYGPATAVALWPEKGWVVAAFWNGSLKVWDLKRGQEVWTLTGQEQGTTPLALWPEPGLAVSASGKTLKVWDLNQGQEVHALTGHNNKITGLALWPGSGLVVSTAKETLKVWDLLQGRCIATFVGESPIIVFQAVPGSRMLVVGEEKGRVHFLKLENFGSAAENTPKSSFQKWIRGLFSKNN